MPAWYAEFRLPILLLQSVVGVFVFAYSLRKRRRFPPTNSNPFRPTGHQNS